MASHHLENADLSKIHRLLYRALIDIRHEGRQLNSGAVFGLADLFHTTVLELERAAKGEIEYSSVLASLQEKAKEKNCHRWIENQLTALSQQNVAGKSQV